MKKIGEGMSSIVLTDGKYAYKVYKHSDNKKQMIYEVNIQNEIYQSTDLNVIKYELDNDRIKMTLLEGENLADKMIKEQDINCFIEFINNQDDIFKYQNLQLPNAFEVFDKRIKKSNEKEELKEKALQSLRKIDVKYQLCHFDYHPENIIYHNDKPYIIDWNNAKLGNPVMDIANTYIIFNIYAKEQADIYLNIMNQKGYSISKIKEAIPLMAFMRFLDIDDKKEKQMLINLVESNK